ncbi:Ulp1 protease family [Theobroma cacao]|nr:Ulp1 protease family [Theobroma cacao]
MEYEVIVGIKNDIVTIKVAIEAIRYKELCVPKFVCTASHRCNPTRDDHARDEPLCKEDGSNDERIMKENMSTPNAPMKDKVKRYIVRKENTKALKNMEIVSIHSGESERISIGCVILCSTLVNKEHLTHQILKIHSGSPSVSTPYKLLDDINDICKYVWNNSSNSEEKIMDFVGMYATRTKMMTLEPRKWLDDTIFMSMNDSNMYWYLCVLNLKEKIVKMFDSLLLSNDETERLNEVAYFENLFNGTLFAIQKTCKKIVVPNDVPRDYDCGMYLCKFMQTVHLNTYHEVRILIDLFC